MTGGTAKRKRKVTAGRTALMMSAIVAGLCWYAQVWPPMGMFWVSPMRSTQLGFGSGGVWVWEAGEMDFSLHTSGWHRVDSMSAKWKPQVRIDRSLPIMSADSSASSVVDGVFVFLPLWIGGAVFALPPLVWLARWRRRKPGHCLCGYDLAGIVSEKCPECGRGIAG